ncbi:MAG TPA: ATP-binding protein, partial [Prolixibacteraceae bacterium]|nr:ATP-binding protein [Prolixibacteraceae bacterium]
MISEDKNCDLYSVIIRDNGCGMTEETAQKAVEPFFTSRTTRKVGLGLPFLKQNAEQAGGSLHIDSEPGKGTVVSADFGLSHIDRPSLGDMAGVFLISVIGHPDIEISYRHQTGDGTFSISSSE